MELDVLRLNDFIEINKNKEVTSPFILAADGNPDTDGIFSYEIFGRVGSEERKLNFGYVDLKRKFIHPFIYNSIYQMYRNLPSIINGERYVVLDVKGVITTVNPDENENAETGIEFFINNWDKINWTSDAENKARAKKESIFATMDKNEIFIDKWLIIPALYRDINLHNTGKGKIDMDEINALYIKLINYASSESITFATSYLTQSNLQNVLVDIHNLLTKKPSGKNGIIHNGIMGKTIDYSVVSVISAPKFNNQDTNSLQIPFNYIGIPLYTLCAMFFPLVVKNLEDIFYDIMHSTEITFHGNVLDVNEDVTETLDSEALNKLVKSYVKDKTKETRTQRFTLSGDNNGNYKKFEELLGRPFTITDLLYRAVSDVIYNKHVLATRYPITGSESIIFCKIKILTTERTVDISNGAEVGTFNYEFMRTYPYIPIDKKGNILTSETHWIDTVVPNNAFLAGMGGDFDLGIHNKIKDLCK